jgi:hypothetical protein
MLGAGWTTMPDFGGRRAGFGGRPASTPSGFCTDGGFIYATARTAAGETVIRLSYHDANMGSPCREGRNRSPMDDAPGPTLSIPEDATSRHNHSGMSGESVEFGTIVETLQPMESLFVHFSAELTEQNWSGSPPLVGRDVAIQHWNLRDTSWQGYLSAARLREGTYALRFVMFDMDRVR